MLGENRRYFCSDHSWTVDISTGELYWKNALQDLTDAEALILKYLVNHPNKVCTLDELLCHVPLDGGHEAIRKVKEKLAKKCTPLSKKGENILQSAYGNGYKFVPCQDAELRLLVDRDLSDGRGIVPPCDKHQPREDVRVLLDTAFSQTNAMLLSGERGIGKSELARAFVRACMERDAPARLCYQKVIWTSFRETIRKTVEALPCVSLTKDNLWSNKINALRHLPGKKLLVIDNADSLTPEDLSSSDLHDLLETGCHILFTACQHLKHCPPTIREHAVAPMDTARLVRLFYDHADGCVPESEAGPVRHLIETYLRRNTYLVVLVAGLCDRLSLSEIMEKFRECNAAGLLSTVDTVKDGVLTDPLSLMGHFKLMYRLADLTAVQARALFNLALLPIEGVPYSRFFRLAFDQEEQTNIDKAIQLLARRYWVFCEFQDGVRRIRIHPMVRELILDQPRNASYKPHIARYIRSLVDELGYPYFRPQLPATLDEAVAAHAGLKKQSPQFLYDKEAVPLFVQLESQIASCYDILTNHDTAIAHAVPAAEKLLRISNKGLTSQERLQYLTCMNDVGYVFVHNEKTEEAKNLLLLARAFLISEYDDRYQLNVDGQILRSKIINNLGAAFLQERTLDKALELHMSALNMRQALPETLTGPDDRNGLLAASYKAIATDYFYLARQENRSANLARSYEFHLLSVAHSEKAFGKDSTEYVIASNRMIGTGLALMEDGGLWDEKSSLLSLWMGILTANLTHLRSVAFFKDEARSCIVFAARIAEAEPALRDPARRILEIARQFPAEHQASLADAMAQLQTITQ